MSWVMWIEESYTTQTESGKTKTQTTRRHKPKETPDTNPDSPQQNKTTKTHNNTNNKSNKPTTITIAGSGSSSAQGTSTTFPLNHSTFTTWRTTFPRISCIRRWKEITKRKHKRMMCFFLRWNSILHILKRWDKKSRRISMTTMRNLIKWRNKCIKKGNRGLEKLWLGEGSLKCKMHSQRFLKFWVD